MHQFTMSGSGFIGTDRTQRGARRGRDQTEFYAFMMVGRSVFGAREFFKQIVSRQKAISRYIQLLKLPKDMIQVFLIHHTRGCKHKAQKLSLRHGRVLPIFIHVRQTIQVQFAAKEFPPLLFLQFINIQTKIPLIRAPIIVTPIGM